MTGDASDEALAARAKAGERRAFEQLVARHQNGAYRLARRYVGSPDDAQDIVQDTFVSAWLGLKRYDAARPFAPWLRAIVLNKCRDFGRRQAVRRLFRRSILIAAPAPASEDPLRADRETQEAERLSRLDSAIAALPRAHKEPLLLTAVAGLSQREAAAQLGLTVKAVEMRVRRARQAVERAISDLKREG